MTDEAHKKPDASNSDGRTTKATPLPKGKVRIRT